LLKKSLIFAVITLFAIQFIDIDKTNPPVDEKLTLKTDPEVMRLLQRSCYDCHSFETKWPYYADIAPVSFFVTSHVKDARQAMNFSLWGKMDEKIKVQRLKRAIVTINNERMALPSYVMAHKDAKLSKDEKETLTKWIESELKTLNEKSLAN
jgi:Haem-binding domain